MTRHTRWQAAYDATYAHYLDSTDSALDARLDTLIGSASIVVASAEANGELAALLDLHESRRH